MIINKVSSSSKTNIIARNTFFLYFRMLLMMFISLYTSRVILKTLGIEDYGVYNVVGGFIAMFGVVNGALSSSISRYLTFEIGRKDNIKLKRVFSTSLNIQFCLALIIVIVAEFFGVWFLNEKMNIPPERMFAANWVFQCSLVAFIINMVSLPYNACIIAHEKMSAFAYISIFEAMLKLLIVFMLCLTHYDRLIVYAVLYMLVGIVLRVIYGIYCRNNFSECAYSLFIDKKLLKEMTKFASWNLSGNILWIVNSQGVGILMNVFFGVVVNASIGIATQVNNAVISMIGNFTTAVNPQITKSFAINDYSYMRNLIFKSSKFSSYMVLLLGIPLFYEINTVLAIWLDEVPKYAAIFVKLYIINTLFTNAMSNSLISGILSIGKLKKTQISTNIISLFYLPLSYLAYSFGGGPEISLIILCLLGPITLFCRVYFIKKYINLSLKEYYHMVVSPVCIVGILCVFIPLPFHLFINNSYIRLITVSSISFICSLCIMYLLGLTNSEKIFLKAKLKSSKIKYIANY